MWCSRRCWRASRSTRTLRPSALRLASGCALRLRRRPLPGLDPDRLDAGELAVLSLAIENPGAIVVLDDRAAREEAIRRNIPLLGTAGILLGPSNRVASQPFDRPLTQYARPGSS